MSRLHEIEKALMEIEGGKFQALGNQYLFRKFGFESHVPYGSHYGTDKTTIGVPDTYTYTDDGYVFIAYTTAGDDIRNKLKKDACDCLDREKTGINPDSIAKIILCHTRPRLSPDIDAEIRAIDPRITIIGPETIASDLNERYPFLANQFLGTAIGRGSFITRDAFVERQRRSDFSTDQSKSLLYREEETRTILNLLNTEDAILLHGRSGCGKTKTALDACTRFCEENGWSLAILESKYSSGADEDIEVVLNGADRVLVLMDDANVQASIDHLLAVCADNKGVKIVMTVRELSYQSLLRKVREHLTPATYLLEPLTKDQISSILEEEYGIKNSTYRERIVGISNGNLRLAVMASISATEGDCSALNEPYDLLESYMVPALEGFSEVQIQALEQFAVLGTFDMRSGDKCFERIIQTGLSPSEIIRLFDDLDSREIVTVLSHRDGTKAVRMEEQNLRDYLICRHFAKRRNGSFAEFILETIALPGQPYLSVAHSMVEVCGSAEVFECMRSECAHAWNALPESDRASRRKFMTAFHNILPEQSLIYAKQQVEARDGKVLAKEAVLGNSSYSDSDILSILLSLSNVPKFRQPALQLLSICIEKGCEKAECYAWACGPGGAFVTDEENVDFEAELTKLELLSEAYAKRGSENAAVCLILLAKSFLKGRAERTTSDGFKVTFSTLQFSLTPQLAKLHASCLEKLGVLSGTEFERDAIEQFRGRIRDYRDEDTDKHNLEVLKGLGSSIKMYISADSTENLACCRYIDSICRTSGEPSPVDYKVFSQATADALDLKSDDAGSSRASRIGSWPDCRVGNAFQILLADCALPAGDRSASSAACDILTQMAESRPSVAVELLNQTISMGVRTLRTPHEAIDILYKSIGRGKLLESLHAAPRNEIYELIVDSIDECAISNRPSDDELNNILARLEDGRLHQTLETLLRLGKAKSSFIAAYTRKYQASTSDPNGAYFFFGPLHDKQHLSKIKPIIRQDLTTFQKLYLLAMGCSHFDLDLDLLETLSSGSESFSSEYIKTLLDRPFHERSDIMQQFARFWLSEEAHTWRLLKLLVAETLSRPTRVHELSYLLPQDSKAVQSEVFWSHISEIIDEYRTSAETIGWISWGFSDAAEDLRVRVIALIMTKDREGRFLEKLHLTRSSMTGTSEEGFIVAKREQIESLDSIADLLPSDMEYLVHKSHLNRQKQHMLDDIEEEQWRIFHERPF